MDLLSTAFLMGLLGTTHCLGMCGGVVGMLSASLDPSISQNSAKSTLYHLSYNSGRILSYVLMGAIFGLAGYLLADMLEISLFDRILRAISGVLMILVGLYIANWYQGIQALEKLGGHLWKKIQPITKKFLPINNLRRAFVTGLLWGGLPCGLVYTALGLAVTTGSTTQGGLVMLAFGLGTLPSLLLMAGFTIQLSRFVQRSIVRKISGFIIIMMGLLALEMPIQSIVIGEVNHQEHTHPIKHSVDFPKPSDFDYLV